LPFIDSLKPGAILHAVIPTKLPIEVLSLPFAMAFNVWHLAEALTVRT